MDFEIEIDTSLPLLERMRRRSQAFDEHKKYITLIVTKSHPFWVENKGWVKAEDLTTDDVVITHDGTRYSSSGRSSYAYSSKDGNYCLEFIYKTDRPNIGFKPRDNDNEISRPEGTFIDLTTGEEVEYGVNYKPVLDKLWISNKQ